MHTHQQCRHRQINTWNKKWSKQETPLSVVKKNSLSLGLEHYVMSCHINGCATWTTVLCMDGGDPYHTDGNVTMLKVLTCLFWRKDGVSGSIPADDLVLKLNHAASFEFCPKGTHTYTRPCLAPTIITSLCNKPQDKSVAKDYDQITKSRSWDRILVEPTWIPPFLFLTSSLARLFLTLKISTHQNLKINSRLETTPDQVLHDKRLAPSIGKMPFVGSS